MLSSFLLFPRSNPRLPLVKDRQRASLIALEPYCLQCLIPNRTLSIFYREASYIIYYFYLDRMVALYFSGLASHELYTQIDPLLCTCDDISIARSAVRLISNDATKDLDLVEGRFTRLLLLYI